MNPLEARAKKIQEIAARLLKDGTVDAVLGHAVGTVPMRVYPTAINSADQAESLTWSSFCTNNLANFAIRRPEGKFAVVAQGCASRNLVGLLKENQIKREDVFVIGVPCTGMVDRSKVAAAVGGRTIHEVVDGMEEIVVKGDGWEETLVRRTLMRENCLCCQQRNPVVYDELAADLHEDPKSPAKGDIEELGGIWDGLDAAGRWAAFQDTIKDCIRCYACRDACPLCYCHVCFVDEAQPQWCGKTQDMADITTFHILRAFHCAGRCTDCGACEAACPQGIKVRRLTSKLEKDVRALYAYSPGMDPKAEPPLNVYRPDDPEDFIGGH